MIAVERGNPEAAAALLDAGADINTVTPLGLTALRVATRRGDAEMLELLLCRGADSALGFA